MNSDFSSTGPGGQPEILTVAELNRRVARLLETGMSLLWVTGEISNLTRAASGHWYFQLKDRDAQVRCVMFRGRNQLVDWAPKDGERIEARAVAGLYAARGEFQLTLESMRRAGAGALYEAFLRLKSKLEAEGLFAAERKRPLPPFVRAVGIVTSLQAAALRDVLAALARRARHVRVIIYPTPVQGKDAPERIAAALGAAGARALHHAETDLILLVRGGGSIEDLWAFNDEALARAIRAAPVPVISGIGHESDFTIADFVADVRAATPTAAAELASEAGQRQRDWLELLQESRQAAMQRRLQAAEQGLDELQRRLRSPLQRLHEAQARLAAIRVQLRRAQGASLARLCARARFATDSLRRSRPDARPLQNRLQGARHVMLQRMASRLAHAVAAVELADARLSLLNPRGALERGYAIVTDAQGHIVHDAQSLRIDQRLQVSLHRGTAIADVVETGPDVI